MLNHCVQGHVSSPNKFVLHVVLLSNKTWLTILKVPYESTYETILGKIRPNHVFDGKNRGRCVKSESE